MKPKLFLYACILAAIAAAVWAATCICTQEPTYHGRTLAEWLGTKSSAGISALALNPVVTGEEPDIVTFRVPVPYQSVTNLGTLRLHVDHDDGIAAEFQECSPATNGDSLLMWNTTYDAPGKYTLHAELHIVNGLRKKRDAFTVLGPPLLFCSSNICQFSSFWSEYDSGGAVLYAKLPSSGATYAIKLRNPGGEHLMTFVGTTSSNEISVKWDLTCEDGKKYSGGEVEAVFQVSLSNSLSGTHIQRLLKAPRVRP